MTITEKLDKYLNNQLKPQLEKAQRAILAARRIKQDEEPELGNYTYFIPSESSRRFYEVSLHVKDYPQLISVCECPAFVEKHDCKHILAAVLLLKNKIAQQENGTASREHTEKVLPEIRRPEQVAASEESGSISPSILRESNELFLKAESAGRVPRTRRVVPTGDPLPVDAPSAPAADSTAGAETISTAGSVSSDEPATSVAGPGVTDIRADALPAAEVPVEDTISNPAATEMAAEKLAAEPAPVLAAAISAQPVSGLAEIAEAKAADKAAAKPVEKPAKKTKKIEADKPERDEEGFFPFKMEQIDGARLEELSGIGAGQVNLSFLTRFKPGPWGGVHQTFTLREGVSLNHTIDIIFDREDGFKTRCTCNNLGRPLCAHVVGAFYYTLQNQGISYFSRFKNFTEEKAAILATYGLSLTDPEAADFKWGYSIASGELKVQKAPEYFVPAGNRAFLNELKASIMGEDESAEAIKRPALSPFDIIDFEIGFLFNFSSVRHIGFELEPLYTRFRNEAPDFKRLNFNKVENLPFLNSLDNKVYKTLLELSDEKILDFFDQKGRGYMRRFATPFEQLASADLQILKNYYFETLKKFWPLLLQQPFIYQLNEEKFSSVAVTEIKLGDHALDLYFEARTDAHFISVFIGIKLGGIKVEDPDAWMIRNGLFVQVDGTLYLPQTTEDFNLLKKFSSRYFKFPVADRADVVSELIRPLQRKYEVILDETLDYLIISGEPQPRVLVSEFDDKFLMIRPQFAYNETVLDYSAETEYFSDATGSLTLIKRDKTEELKLYEYLRNLHPNFGIQRNNMYYYLPFAEVMKAGWFVQMIQALQQEGIMVYGLAELKKFRYNTSKPTFDMKGSSGIDWFELKIQINWGENEVALSTIKKAILKNQDAVLLDDGTLGLIPKEWLEKYSLLLKISTEKDGVIEVSKMHYSVLDQLSAEIEGDDLLDAIAEKKKKLSEFSEVKILETPSPEIHATLRPYQLAGFHWMQTLDELEWGGILADDMGLGKTLQAITFLKFLQEKHNGSTHLIVCPTSLIFNWESELVKFCPSLKFHTYYGNMRSFDDTHFDAFDIILTSYGVIRLDIELLAKFKWHYIILDESQAIKNPDAQVTRSVQVLKAKNRLLLSGTPVQNNTYDLYAQFHFLNPGFLGTREFFKQEFANPIDKLGDKDKSDQLRKMVYPFMLRRTKEQVATDLPDKTETIIWCSMEPAQRAVYEEYKNYYRDLLLQKISVEGIARSGIYILEGLLRLRQICDSPLLLKDHTIKGGNNQKSSESVKVEELMREITENSGGHKLLVFSQFTEMLQLISNELKAAGTSFCYLDGSTPALKRKEEVNRFQEDQDVKVFLISLKAGGVGLNLTAADYVYLVDPWWNPAAEQQAIDRTHRIGQKRKVFAYKMICKDSIEEKILEMQGKKKLLADDLISEDKGMLKKLTVDDVRFLFS